MSCHILDRDDIHRCVQIIQREGGRLAHRIVGFEPSEEVGESRLGATLWQLNLLSVRNRYPDDLPGERPGPIDFKDEDAVGYRFQPVRSSVREEFESLMSLLYNSTEACDLPRGLRTYEAVELAAGSIASDLLRSEWARRDAAVSR